MKRRRFLEEIALGTVALQLAGRAGWAAPGGGDAEVVLVRWPGTAELTGEARAARLEAMLTAGIERLSGRTGADAWQTYIQPTDTVGLKVNCLAARRPTSPDLTDLVARQLLAAGVAGERCLVFDRFARELTAAGYAPGEHPAGYRIVATDQPEYGWEAEPTAFGQVNQQVSRLVGRELTALINLPVLKDHNIGGVTGALKNHCGNIRQPQQCHADRGDPFFADVAALPPFVAKQRLVIGDGLTIIYDGGPSDRPDRRHQLDTLLLATDPVAHDTVMWQLIEGVRTTRGLRPLSRVGRDPSYLQTAAAPPRNLGVAEPARIALSRLDLG